jgi:CheY-like chemotaxis protein
MTKPLAVIFYQNLLLGSQVVNRLQDLGYRVQTAPALDSLVEQAERELPLVMVFDLAAKSLEACDAIARLRKLPATAHIPVIAIAGGRDQKLEERARKAGATLVARETAFLEQLPSLLDQVLSLD